MNKLIIIFMSCLCAPTAFSMGNQLYNDWITAAQTGDNPKIQEFIALNPNTRLLHFNDFGSTALHIAAFNGHVDIVQTLVGPTVIPLLALNGETVHDYVNQPKIEGNTPLHEAAYGGNSIIIQILLDHGALINAKDRMGNTALHIACNCNHADAIQTLLAAHANVDIQNNDGWTPLFFATHDNRPRVVQLLLNANARIDLQGKIGELMMSPLELAKKHGRNEITKLINDHRCREILPLLEGQNPRLGVNNPLLQNMPTWIYADIFNLLNKANR